MQERPWNIKWFEWIVLVQITLSTLYSAFYLFLRPQRLEELAGQISVPIMQGILVGGLVFTLIFTLWIIAKVRRHKNWARWLFTLVVAVGALSEFRHFYEQTPIERSVNAVSTAASIVAALLLFTGQAREWFKNTPI